jgi:hypothetical protein
MAYSITINSSAAARALAAENGYNFVFAKRADVCYNTPRRSLPNFNNTISEYTTVWTVLNPNDIGDSVTVSWDTPVYSATYAGGGNSIDVESGGSYNVDANGTMISDPDNHPWCEPAITFRRTDYEQDYTPILLTQDPSGNKVPFWTASQGMAHHNDDMLVCVSVASCQLSGIGTIESSVHQ